MTRFTRILTLATILLGQIVLTGQTFAMADCHGEEDRGDMVATGLSLHPDHDTHAGDHTHAEGKAPSGACQCADGVHCGQLTLVLAPGAAMPDVARAEAHHPPEVMKRPALAHRRNPDRPPA